jgi:hypothetical protein
VDRRPLSQLQRTWLQGELKVWQAQGLVRAEQVEDILGLYEMPQERADRQQSLALFALQGIALLFVGLAILLVIGYNWQALPAAAKLIVLFGGLLIAHGAGLYLRYRRAALLASELVFFFGCLLYGASIWLIAQIFHINSHYPDGLWMWALGVLPFALALDTLLLHALLVAILALWVGTEVLGFSDFGMWLFRRWPTLPNGAYTLTLFAGIGLLWSYRKGSPFTAGLYVALLTWWVARYLSGSSVRNRSMGPSPRSSRNTRTAAERICPAFTGIRAVSCTIRIPMKRSHWEHLLWKNTSVRRGRSTRFCIRKRKAFSRSSSM